MLVWFCVDRRFSMSVRDHTQCGVNKHQVLQMVRVEHWGTPGGRTGQRTD